MPKVMINQDERTISYEWPYDASENVSKLPSNNTQWGEGGLYENTKLYTKFIPNFQFGIGYNFRNGRSKFNSFEFLYTSIFKAIFSCNSLNIQSIFLPLSQLYQILCIILKKHFKNLICKN